MKHSLTKILQIQPARAHKMKNITLSLMITTP